MAALEIQHLSEQQQELIRNAENKVLHSIDTSLYWKNLETFADLLDQVGLHGESRKNYIEIVSRRNDPLTAVRCRRKILSSFISQRDFKQAPHAAQEALEAIKLLSLEEQEVIDEFFRIHVEAGFVNYFTYQAEKVHDSVNELRRWQHCIKDTKLRTGFMHVVALSLLLRYRWYKMPEEAFTHGELFLQHARASGDSLAHSMALCNQGFIYLWNEEITISRKYLMEAVDLLKEKNYSPLLMAYNYITLGYRMQNNVSMTEQWANLTLNKAIQTGNLYYLPYSNANLAWVWAKRKNWLYAEDYAIKAREDWGLTPLLFSYCFVLMECLLKKNEFDQAGQYAYMLLHPNVKKLPETVTQKLRPAISAWVRNNTLELSVHLTDAITEAKITGYY